MPLFPIVRDAATASFLDACERGEFPLVRDVATGTILDPKTDISSDPERYEVFNASGAATVISWSEAPGTAGIGSPTSILFGIVELAEGPWWWTELHTNRPLSQLTGSAARLAFIKTGPEPHHATVPYFIID